MQGCHSVYDECIELKHEQFAAMFGGVSISAALNKQSIDNITLCTVAVMCTLDRTMLQSLLCTHWHSRIMKASIYGSSSLPILLTSLYAGHYFLLYFRP